MAIQENTEYLRALTLVERFNFHILHYLNTSPRIRQVLTKIGSIWGGWYVELGTSNIVLDHGFENFEKLDPQKAVLMVVNHRTFFDQFVIIARLFRMYGAHHNIYFPVRANFFYDNLLGLLINLKFSVGGMYPPIIRDKKRRIWNRYATDLMADILTDPTNLVGYHPEGTRNRGPDPYALLPPKPGCGELIHRTNPNVIPVFLQGFPKTAMELVRKNWSRSASRKPIVHMVMGEPLVFDEEVQLEAGKKTYLQISKKVMAAIEGLAKKERQIRANYQEPAVT